MEKVVALGEILVEVMAEEAGRGFREPIKLVGPFASGAPAIFIDQVAKLGQACGLISCVGDDDFGWLNCKRLGDDGVDIRAIEVSSEYPTGSAFVRYTGTGERDFVYNIRSAASGHVRLTATAMELLDECGWLHISGTSFLSAANVEMVKTAVGVVNSNGGGVSFDPNLRREMMGDAVIRGGLRWVLERCNMFLPSGEELTLLTAADGPEGAVTEILALGVGCIVVKRGARGASYHDPDGALEVAGYRVEEVDPTGAGDCFDATFVTCRLQGRSVVESLDYANASGAYAVTRRGPMEGTATFAQLEALMKGRSRREGPLEGRLDGGTARVAEIGDKARWIGRSSVPAVTSVCSAHPLVIEAAMLRALADGSELLIEATCNQVNHAGGYTGLTPVSFRDQVHEIADRVGVAREQVLLGGDHLGPNPWRHLPAEAALAEAEKMVAAYVAARYQNIDLDTSMGCLGEPEHLPDHLAAERAARLALVAEEAARSVGGEPRYVIGTEVPVPGGARAEIEHLEVTAPGAVLATVEAHRRAFASLGAQDAFDRVMAVVVQPGVEFDNEKVVVYEADRGRELSAALADLPGMVFEAHSTDYQPPRSLVQLVGDGFAILKVGPALTFALREGLYALDQIATALDPGWSEHSLIAEMETEMLGDPRYWQAYYHGDASHLRVLRHFSYSDRIRYYWSSPGPRQAVRRLFDALSGRAIAGPLVSQFLPTLYPRVASGELDLRPRDLVLALVNDVLSPYSAACRAGTTAGL